ncbi:hypothetical protein JHK86_055600 [Glycine max]|nr:hypothetical protein JHK86_055600 [Glycine max]
MALRLTSKTKGVNTLDIWPWKYLVPWIKEHLFERLDEMLYVGLTKKHRESATMFANVVGIQVISQLNAPNTSLETTHKIEEMAQTFRQRIAQAEAMVRVEMPRFQPEAKDKEQLQNRQQEQDRRKRKRALTSTSDHKIDDDDDNIDEFLEGIITYMAMTFVV